MSFDAQLLYQLGEGRDLIVSRQGVFSVLHRFCYWFLKFSYICWWVVLHRVRCKYIGSPDDCILEEKAESAFRNLEFPSDGEFWKGRCSNQQTVIACLTQNRPMRREESTKIKYKMGSAINFGYYKFIPLERSSYRQGNFLPLSRAFHCVVRISDGWKQCDESHHQLTMAVW